MNGLKACEILSKYKKILAWGTGEHYREYAGAIPLRVAYLIDSNSEKWGQKVNELEIFHPDRLKEEDATSSLVVIATARFDEVSEKVWQYGPFDVLMLSNLYMICEHEKEYGSQEDFNRTGCRALVCSSMEALWQRNGAARFIKGQFEILRAHNIDTYEIAPVVYYEAGTKACRYLAVSINRHYVGIFALEDFRGFGSFHLFIINSLYYSCGIIPKLIEAAKPCKTLYYLHDYFALCSNRFLYFKGNPCVDEKGIMRCRECNFSEKGEAGRLFHKKLFNEYGVTVVAPSYDTAKRMRLFFPDADIKVIPHLRYETVEYELQRNSKLKIAFLGIAVEIKGWEGFCHLVAKYKTDYDFYCLGDCCEASRIDGVRYIHVEPDSMEYPSMTHALKENAIDIAYIGSICPETYSYTYFEAFEAGCYVISTSASGNVCDQVRKNHNGKVFRNLNEMGEWLGDHEEVVKAVSSAIPKIENVNDNDLFLKSFLWELSKKNRILNLSGVRCKKGFHNIKISLVVFLYYEEELEWYVNCLQRIPEWVEMYIFSSRESVLRKLRVLCEEKNVAVKALTLKENRGRDISALLVAARDIVLSSDIIGFIHDKGTNKKHIKKETQDWIQGIWNNLIPSYDGVEEIVSMFDDRGLGIIFPPDPLGKYVTHWYDNHWLANLENAGRVGKELGIGFELTEMWEPIGLGTCFWARTSAIRKFYTRDWSYVDFPREPLVQDGAINHAIEHLLGIVAMDSGFYCNTVMTHKYAEDLLMRSKSCAAALYEQISALEPVFNLNQVIGLDRRINKLLEYASKHEDLYIYGAGNYGIKLLRFFDDRKVSMKGFLTTREVPPGECICGRPLCSLDAADIKENDGIIIAVSVESLSEIENELKNRGIKDYIYGY